MSRSRRHEPRTPAARRRQPSSRRWLLAAAVLLALAVTAGVVAWRAAPSRIARDAGLSVLLVSIDTLRADALGAYGHPSVRTPWIDRLAREGVRFTDAHAHNVVTLPSHANMLSGRYPLLHGVHDNSGFRFPADVPTLATLLKERGYATGAFVSAFPIDSRFGLDRGFDVYDDRLAGAENRTLFFMPERPGPQTVAAAAEWLGRNAGRRRLCFLHLYEPHFPYAPPEPFRTHFPATPYFGEVEAADAALEPVLRPLLEAGGRSRTLVVLTSDHGESLGEHGEATHGVFAYEATLRVPLLLWAPGVLPAKVVSEPARHVDLLPTLLDALGIETPAGLAGRSLLGAIAGARVAAADSYFEALSSSFGRGWAPLHGVISGGLKYIALPLPELFDLAADPREERNLIAARPAERERLAGALAGLLARDRPSSRVAEDPAALDTLRALGYVSAAPGTPKRSYGPADDPKNLVALDARARDVLALFENGRLDEAIALSRQTLAERDDMPLVWLQLAYLERAKGDLGAAIGAARRALQLRPTDNEALALVAVYLNEAGRPAEALQLIEPHAKAGQPDVDVLTAQGMALAALGRTGEALRAFERVRQLDPSNAGALVNAGTVRLMAGELDAAREAFQAALALDGRQARAENSLGVIAMREGRPQEAVERWRRAVDLDPGDYQTLFNLGALLRQAGREPEARPYLEAYLKAAPVALEARDIARVRAWLGRSGGGAR